MTIKRFGSRQALSIVCAVVLAAAGLPLAAQPAPPPAQLLPPSNWTIWWRPLRFILIPC